MASARGLRSRRMRRIIDGKAHDTETATEVASGSNDHELSDASWSLYRTAAGAWFEVAAGHDGVVEEFQPLTDGAARRWLERHANKLVEKYFGQAPEASSADHKGLRFSRRTLVAAIGVLECLTHASLSRFLYDLGPDFSELAGDESISLSKRLTGNPLPQANAYAMIQRRAKAAEISTKIGNHTFGRPASPPISRTEGRSRKPRRWPTTPARGRRSSTTGARRK